jgi:EmrB/QacA subfamily drug resistance transporter
VNEQPLDPRRWKALAVAGAGFLMTILDISVVNVALPTLGADLHFSQENLQWVISAYAITFGGFLLLGGRAADLLGRRTVFMTGVGIFTAASLACGLASSEGFLIVMRGVQGLAGALIAPSALSIVSTAFPEGAERNKALGVWGALGGSGGAIGVILGGVLVKYAGWEWIFFVNVPVGALVIALSPVFIRESRLEVARRRYDPLGAVAITASIMLLVYSISKAPDVGWATGRTIGLLIASAVLLAAFLAIEARVHEPLMPLSIWRLATVRTANLVGIALGAIMFSAFFLLTLYAQQVLGYSPLQTGAAMLATGGTTILAAGLAEGLVTRIGPKAVMTVGLAATGASLVWLAQIPVGGNYLTDLLGPLLLAGLGIGLAFVPLSIVALAGVPPQQMGLASGLMNTTQQVGAAVGVAVASTIFATRFAHEVADVGAPRALVSGLALAYWFLAIAAFVGCAIAFVLLRNVRLEAEPEAPVETHVVLPFCFNASATGALADAVRGDEVAEPAVTA